jgi:malate dehydrogenase (oxaloacetate-decarboxylating)(NADP+)
MDREKALEYHAKGKIGLRLTKDLATLDDLCMAYTPGVAEPVKEISARPLCARDYTAKGNSVAVVTDGSAILGLGNLGALAGIPVMEGKAALFKVFGDVDAWPVPLDGCRTDDGSSDPGKIIEYACAIAPMYGGINLEDIAAPACFEVEDRLDSLLDIPVFHDDQWGTAVITLAGVMNYSRLCEREMEELRIVINGAGAAGIRIAEMLRAAGAKSILLCDSMGVVRSDRRDLSGKKKEHAVDSNAVTVEDALKDAHVFIGVSIGNCISGSEIEGMASYPAIFAMANPDPEIRPEAVAGVLGSKPYVIATGRSDYPNQVNNVLGFPFLFRGALDTMSNSINTEMKVAAAEALARVAHEPVPDYVQSLYPDFRLQFGPRYVIPKPFDPRLLVEVSAAVAEAAVASGAARVQPGPGYRRCLEQRKSDLAKENQKR